MTASMRRRAGRVGAAALGVTLLLGHAGSARAAEATPRPSRAPARIHEVRRGDTLGGIARRYGVSVAALVAVNRLGTARVTLRPGQRLIVPPPGPPRGRRAALPPGQGRRPAAPPRPPATMALAIPDFEDVAPPFRWPVEGPVTSPFGRRRSAWHRGIDIRADQGTPIAAAAAGVVVAAGVEPRYGRVIKIEHDGGFLTVYAHNDENLVQAGARVGHGEPIATVGRTGRATTHHLHFEIRRGSVVYNPLYLLPLPPRVAQVDETDEDEPDGDE